MKSARSILTVAALSFVMFAFAPFTVDKADSDIVTLASETEDLSTLVAAVKAADLVETLQGDGPFTVFAPSNAAFEKLPEGTVESLLKPENKEKLTKILTYHVVSGKVMSGDLKDGMKVETVQGSQIEIKLGDNVMVNGAKVETADVEATNGVVHIIDSVIMPPSDDSGTNY